MTSNGHCSPPPHDYLGPVSILSIRHGQFLWEPGSRAGREDRKTAPRCPQLSGAGCGKGGTHAAATFGFGEQRGTRWLEERKSTWKTLLGPCSSAPLPVGSAAAGIFCLYLNEVLEVRPSVLHGTLQHQRAGKGFNIHLRSLLHTQSSLHCLDTEGNKVLTGFPETTNNLMTPFTYKSRINWKADKGKASFWPI